MTSRSNPMKGGRPWTRKQLAALVTDARTDDAAWHALVVHFTPQVDAVLAAEPLSADGRERASRAAWAGLAMRLHLPDGPEDVETWLVTRVRREARRVLDERHRADAARLARRKGVLLHHPDVHDRRTSRERRRLPRGDYDRRS